MRERTQNTDGVNAASVALAHRGRVLLIQRAYEPYRHLWTLPGGRREAGETAEQCVAREVHEELGLKVFALRHITTQDLTATGYRLAVFATEAFEGEIVASDEVAAHRWVRPDELTALNTTARLDEVVERVFSLFLRS